MQTNTLLTNIPGPWAIQGPDKDVFFRHPYWRCCISECQGQHYYPQMKFPYQKMYNDLKASKFVWLWHGYLFFSATREPSPCQVPKKDKIPNHVLLLLIKRMKIISKLKSAWCGLEVLYFLRTRGVGFHVVNIYNHTKQMLIFFGGVNIYGQSAGTVGLCITRCLGLSGFRLSEELTIP